MSGEFVEVKLPKWGMMMEEATIVEWLKKEGDRVTKEEEIVMAETEKLTNPVKAPITGILSKVIAKEGDVVPVGGSLALIKPE